MSRFDRLTFDALTKTPADRRTKGIPPSRLPFYWLRDDDDRKHWLDSLKGKVQLIDSQALIEDDPAPLRSSDVKQGVRQVALISDPRDVSRALQDTEDFSNAPYAELGGASFMLAIDIEQDPHNWHAEQRRVAETIFAKYDPSELEAAARVACQQAAILSLRAPIFDMAEWAEQAALRYFGLVFGFGAGDHGLLEDAARSGYRALQYVIVGRHFVSEPGTLPAAQRAMARLATRSSALMDEYAWRALSPRAPIPPSTTSVAADWPEGVQAWSELDLRALGKPVLRQLPELASKAGARAKSSQLNDQALCNMVAGLLVGTVGNVQTALCQMMQALFVEQGAPGRDTLKPPSADWLRDHLADLLARHPPVPFLPRRTRGKKVMLNGGEVDPFTDCILALRPPQGGGCPHVWGGLPPEYKSLVARHACLGQAFIEPLLLELLKQSVNLPGLAECLDPRTGETLKPERLWGMGCMRYPLRHDREQLRVQQPLIVVMRVKSPIAEHAERLRQLVRSGAPRIQSSLDSSGMVHFAWFEFMENDSLLALRTVYDGDFDAYIEHFALKTGDLFDLLFQSLEGAPTMPIAEHPHEFVETIRRNNRGPLGGYFYSAYPATSVALVKNP